MLKCDLNFYYSESDGMGIEFDSLPDKLKINLGQGIENISFTLNDNQARELLERLMKEVYGENTLEEAEDTITNLEAKLEMEEEKIDQLEEYHGIRF